MHDRADNRRFASEGMAQAATEADFHPEGILQLDATRKIRVWSVRNPVGALQSQWECSGCVAGR